MIGLPKEAERSNKQLIPYKEVAPSSLSNILLAKRFHMS